MKGRMRKRMGEEAVTVDEAIRDVRLITPAIGYPFGQHGDSDDALEIAARREEGMGRHGFRSLISELE